MPLLQRKRRAQLAEEEASDDYPVEQTQTQRRGRRRESPSSESDDYGELGGETQDGALNVEQMAKKLVRLALACEYSRQPIRRADITAKVLSPGSRQFKAVLDEAQIQLRVTFGMEMPELPIKEKITLQQRRAAQRSENTSKSSGAWVLASTLPSQYHIPDILTPSQIPTADTESAYIGLYSFIVSIIYLAGGQITESKLMRYLKRTNADQSTPIDKTEKLLDRLVREGYIVRVKGNSTGEEVVDYMVGSRGKVEIGADGAAEMVRQVYGDASDDGLERKLARSLGLSEPREAPATTNGANGANGKRTDRGRPRRQTDADGESDDGD